MGAAAESCIYRPYLVELIDKYDSQLTGRERQRSARRRSIGRRVADPAPANLMARRWCAISSSVKMAMTLQVWQSIPKKRVFKTFSKTADPTHPPHGFRTFRKIFSSFFKNVMRKKNMLKHSNRMVYNAIPKLHRILTKQV